MLTTAIKIAEKAADVLNSHRAHLVKHKSGNDIVTDVDIISERFIEKSLKKAFPTHKVYSEEKNKISINAKYLWVVDPLDGTINFTSGIPLFSVSMGLLVDGKPVMGVVCAPKMNETFYAEKGKGAFLNSKRLKVSVCNNLKQSIVSVGIAPHFNSKLLKQAGNLVNLIVPKVRGIRVFESGALIKCYVACGRIDAHIGVKTDPFGAAASVVIIEEAGGRITDFQNCSWSVSMQDLICSNGLLHKKVLNLF